LMIASPVFALVASVVFWASPTPGLGKLLRLGVPAATVVILLCVVCAYYLRVVEYYREVDSILMSLRSVVLNKAGVTGPGPSGNFEYEISGISEESGSIRLVLDEASSSALRVGTTLAVIAIATGEEWGTVRITELEGSRAKASVVDRKRPEFWESLEDRMKTDPSPPPGFHLSPYFLHDLQCYVGKEGEEVHYV